MSAIFQVTTPFPLGERKMFVLPGVIKKGTVKVGMKMRPKGSVIDLVPITGVELVDSVGEKRDSAVALCATYRDATELKGLQSLFGEGSVLEVED